MRRVCDRRQAILFHKQWRISLRLLVSALPLRCTSLRLTSPRLAPLRQFACSVNAALNYTAGRAEPVRHHGPVLLPQPGTTWLAAERAPRDSPSSLPGLGALWAVVEFMSQDGAPFAEQPGAVWPSSLLRSAMAFLLASRKI